jgi:serine protease AprX
LPLVSGVSAQLSASEISALQSQGLAVTPDTSVQMQMTPVSGVNPVQDNVFPQLTGASRLWNNRGITGAGVTVAVVDTGIDALPDFAGRLVDGVDLTGENAPFQDDYGHGTFVAGLVAGNGASSNGLFTGEAPGANLVSVKVAGASGATDIATIISGINWVIQHAAADNIRVLNLSFGAIPTGPAASEPLDSAVEQAWQAGIVVVVSAGNAGSGYGSITSPGDDPMVVTVGAFNDNATTSTGDDSIPSFSSVGPTSYDALAKPDLVAPGQHVVSLAAPGSTIASQYPSALIGGANFIGSGTSFAAAITSGAAALVMQAHPDAVPNGVKGRLLASATAPAWGDPLVAGHGDLSAFGATAMAQIRLPQLPASLLPAVAGTTVSMGSVWAQSSWNPANYTGIATLSAGWNSAGWNSAGWNSAGWNSAGWNSAGWNSAGWNSAGWNSAGWNSAGWNSAGWNSAGWNSAGWN